MDDTQREALKKRIREALQTSLPVWVLGWKASNHDRFTAATSPEKVIFSKRRPYGHVSLVLLTRFIDHAMVDQMKRRKLPIHPVLLENGVIKELLKSCQDILFQPSRTGTKEPQGEQMCAPPALVAAPPVAPVLAQSAEETMQMNDMQEEKRPMSDAERFDAFVQDFLWISENSQGLVGTHRLTELRERHGIEKEPRHLIAEGWITPHVSEGRQKAGSYRPGPRMRAEHLIVFTEPGDPIERARVLIGKKDALLKEQVELEGKLSAVKTALSKIETAEKMLSDLSELMNMKL